MKTNPQNAENQNKDQYYWSIRDKWLMAKEGVSVYCAYKHYKTPQEALRRIEKENKNPNRYEIIQDKNSIGIMKNAFNWETGEVSPL